MDLLNSLKSILPFNTDSIESITTEVGKLYLYTSNGERFVLKLSKLPDTKPSNELGMCKTFFYKNQDTGEVVYKPKVFYTSDSEAIKAAQKMNILDRTIHKYVAYKCLHCHQWHIGKNGTELSQSDKEKIRRKHNL